MNKSKLSTQALENIAGIMAKLLNGQINSNSIHKNEDFTSFGYHSELLQSHIGFSYYHNDDRFHGNIDGGGHFSGTIANRKIRIMCSQTSNIAFVSY